MKAIKFTNSLGHEQILNLSSVSMIEKQTHQNAIVLHFAKEHMHITLKTSEERDDLFERICTELGVG
jgi:type II secretory pathway component PulL